ncbi:MAG: pyridoxal-phosphate dependent enzyme [Sandaracinus sp.]
MNAVLPSILGSIGKTPIVKLNRLGEGLAASLYVKCDFLLPSGSAKDRVALHLVKQAEKRGELKPGGTIIEATDGGTGGALAMLAAVRGYRAIFVLPDKVSHEKIAALKAFGAKVVVCPTALDPDDARSIYAVAKRLASETPNAFYANQHHNRDNPGAHATTTGPEIWEQMGGQIDVLVAGLGTGGTLAGAGRYLKQQRPGLKVVGVDPVGSVYYDLAKSGRVTKPFSYKVEGIGADFLPSTIDLADLDDVVRVDDKECFLTTRELVRLEGLFVGGASGAAVAGAIKHARASNTKQNIVIVLGDRASMYLSKIFNDDWMRENGFLEDDGLGLVGDLLKHKSDEIITAHPADRVRDVIARMKAHGISQLPVVEEGRLLGAVAEVDLLRYLVSGEHSLDSSVGPLAESDYATVSPRTSIENLQGLLNNARMAIVIDEVEAKIVGVVTKIDLIDYLARRAS